MITPPYTGKTETKELARDVDGTLSDWIETQNRTIYETARKSGNPIAR